MNPDEYEIKAENICRKDACRGYGSGCHAAMAEFGRESARRAYQDAMQILFDAERGLPSATAWNRIGKRLIALKPA